MVKETVQTGGNFSFHPKSDPDKYRNDPVKKKFESAYNTWQRQEAERRRRQTFIKKILLAMVLIIAIVVLFLF